MFIINHINQIVSQGTSVQVSPEKYGKYPVIVTDTTASVTAGWSLMYMAQRSKFEEKLVDFRGRFSEIVIANANTIISDIEVVLGKFRSGENVRQFNNTATATYETPTVWYTLTQRAKGVSIVMTVTDEASPFHMLQMTFFVMNESNGRHPLVGYDHCYNQETNTWTDKRDSASLSPSKRQVIPVIQPESNDGPKLAKVSGQIAHNGLIALDLQNTQVDYIQNYTNERRLIAGLYENVIMNHALTMAFSNLPASTASSFGGQAFGGAFNGTQNSFGQQPQQQTQNAFGGQQQQQQQSFGQQTQQGFTAPQQQTQNAFGQQPQQNAFGQQPQQQQQQTQPQQQPVGVGAGATDSDMPTW